MGVEVVVADTAFVAAEEFPAASKAETVYEYVVFGKRPVSENETLFVTPIDIPLRKI